MKKRKIGLTTIVIILVAILAFDIGGYGTKFSSWLKSEARPEDGLTPECLTDRLTLTIGRVQDIYKPSNTVDDNYHRVFVNGADRGLFIDGSSLTLTPAKDKVDIYYAINATAYYSNIDSFTAPCASQASSAEIEGNEGWKLFRSANEDASNISEMWSCKATDDGAKIIASNTQPVSSATYYTIVCTIESTPYETFSPVGKAGICFDYQASNFTEAPSIMNEDYFGMVEFITPSLNTNTVRCFSLPSIKDKPVNYQVQLYPANDAPGVVRQYLIDQDNFRHSKTREMVIDYEDDLGNDVGSTYEVINDITTS